MTECLGIEALANQIKLEGVEKYRVLFIEMIWLQDSQVGASLVAGY
jgi:hypothetical protein